MILPPGPCKNLVSGLQGRYAGRVRFAILGSVEVRREGIPVTVGGPKQRALLAMLLLQAGRPVSRDALIEGLWGERPPAGAVQTLDTYLSKLRRALGGERIVRRPPGYLIAVQDDELDLRVFDGLVARARCESDPRAAAALLREALDLWRGPALADLRYEPFAPEEGVRLDERRAAAVEDLNDARLALGEGAELVAELEEHLAADPLSERLAGQLMLALYRAGRQADALDVFQALRRGLATELGLDPGPRLQELERQILNQDPELLPVRPLPPHRRRPRRLTWAVAVGAALAAAAAVSATLLTTDQGSVSQAAVVTDRLVAIGATDAPGSPVRLPGSPASLAVSAGSLWVADPDDQLVARVSPRSNTVVDRIPIGGQPGSVVAEGRTIWVASTLGGGLSRVDPGTDRVVQTVHVGRGTTGSISLAHGRLWVADSSDRSVVELDAHTGARLRVIRLAVRPSSVLATGGAVWVAAQDAGVVVRLDSADARLAETIRVGNGPTALAAASGAVWVANGLDSTVSRIDPQTAAVTATIPVPSGPSALAVSPGGLWVASQYAGTVTLLGSRTNRAIRTVEVGGAPTTLVAAGDHVWAGAAATPGSHRGGTLVLDATQRFSTIDPALHFTASPPQFGHLTYDGLVTYEMAPGPAGLRLVPDLAVAVPTPTNGGRVYTFQLRRGIRYSDGRPLHATDFRRGIERLFRVHAQGASYYAAIAGAGRCSRHPSTCDLRRGIVTDDAHGIVSFRLRRPDPDLLPKLTVYAYGAPIPPGTPAHDVGRDPIPGTGPYRIASWDGSQIRLVRNAYFREWSHAAQPSGNPDVIVWRFVPSAQAAIADVRAGRADWFFGLVPPRQLGSLELRYPAQFHLNPAFIFEFAPLNTHLPPFDHLAVRRALNLAVDRAKIARMYGGTAVATPLCQAIFPGMPGHRPYCPYERDVAAAKRLVRRSGTAGERIDVWGLSDEIAVPNQVPAYVASVLRSLGYVTRLHMVPSHSVPERLRRSFQISVDGDWLADYPSPSSYLPQFFSCGGGYSNGYVCDRTLDRKMHRATVFEVAQPGRAEAAWAQVDRRITDEALWVPTVTLRTPEFVSARLRDYQFHPMWGFIADQAWLR